MKLFLKVQGCTNITKGNNICVCNVIFFIFQSEWIRQNCAVQMERVRENYNFQVQNLRGIRDYGSCQVTAVRDQYYEQVKNQTGCPSAYFLTNRRFINWSI